MAYTIDVDVGGTLTDGLFSDGQRAEMVKVDTTPHDFTVCFFDCLREGARRFGHADLVTFLQDVAVVRWSSTIATNVVAQRTGPRVGLLTDADPPQHLFGAGPSPAVGFLVDPEHLARVGVPVDRDEVLRAVRRLLESGVRRICISFSGPAGADAERQVKAWIEEQYPDHYLGSVPVLLGHDMLAHPDDQTRTHLALINAYVHTPLASGLFKAEDELQALRYRKPVYIGHVNGGVARVSKTKGVDTTESGPVFGLAASGYFARAYGKDAVLSVDVGGTTTKLGAVRSGQPAVADEGELFGIPLQVPWVVLHSVALGGGSVARVEGGSVVLGPESMGAYPGPACYELGSRRATLTDAFVLGGWLNPDRFLGGRRRLNVEGARAALEEDVARPLGVDADESAWRVIQRAVATIADVARRSLGDDAAGATLFAFGGNGANLAVATADALGCREAVVFRLGPVFSALGSSLARVRHLAEAWPMLRLGDADAASQIAATLDAGRDRVLRDVAGEGFAPAEADVHSELLVHDAQGTRTVTVQPGADGSYGDAVAAIDGSGPLVERASVVAVCDVPAQEPPAEAVEPHRPQPTGHRDVVLEGGRQQAPVYDWDELRPGAELTGPAVLDASANSCPIPAGWRFAVDGYGNGRLARSEGVS
jgi:N-methylhydantoinase A